MRSGIVVISILLACVINTFGQQARETFGKNRIQYRQFDWQYLSGENFDIYYYDNQKEMAHDALEYLEHEFDRITDLIDYPPYFKTKVFLYRSLADLRQSNVGLNHTVFNVGGETEFIKPYVEVANPGTVEEFKDELLSQISDLMINEMMFGGNLKDVFQSSLLMNLPDWFVDGAALYVAKGWNAEMDDYIRQFMATKRSKKITKLSGREAALAGQSVWNFIAEKYGKSSVSNILNYTRVTRNEEKSVLITLGVPFKQLMTEWQRYYTDITYTVNKSYVPVPDSAKYTRQRNKTTVYSTVKLSPDGRYIAFAENDRGNFVVRVRPVKVKEWVDEVIRAGAAKHRIHLRKNFLSRNIVSGGTKVINQRVDYRLPIISWADENILGVVGLKHGRYVFWLYDFNTKSKTQRELDKFSNVRSLNFSNNGRLAILSADFEGRNDLFLLSTRRDKLRRLTNDLYDDLDPSFIPNSNKIVFSSNRSSDSLRTKLNPDFGQLPKSYSLFMYDLDSVGSDLQRITNTLSKDYAPIAADEFNFYYLSDQRGIINVFKFNRTTGIYTQVTNFSSGIIEYDLNLGNRMLAFVAANKLRQNIYVLRDFNIDRQVFTPPTRRKELQTARIVYERKKKEENKNMSIKDLLNSRLKQTQPKDSVQAPADSVHHINNNPVKADTVIVDKKAEDIVNTDNYQFEEEQQPAKQNQPVSDSFISRYIKARDKSRITGPFKYESKFSANNMVTTLLFDPLRGLGVSLETQMNDMLENYRFYGGLMTAIDLKRGSNAYAEFQYLPRLIDFSARFDRKAIRWTTQPRNDADSLRQFHYSLNKFEVGASLPLTDRFRFTVKPFAAYTRTVDNGRLDVPDPTFAEPVNHYYAGFKSELIYDNSVSGGLNIIEGTRGKISFVNYQGIGDSKLSFSQASIDLRHYQKIYKDIVFAVRGFAGTFFGNSPKLYLLGGMDNWLFNNSRTTGSTSKGEPNPIGVQKADQDLLFVEYVTSLRGFNYATIFGNNALLFNAELRIPLVRALTNAPVNSPFFKNLQFVAFYDIGTSWSGAAPFTAGHNSVSYNVVKNGPFEAKIKNYLNPWLYSYGAGMRTVLFGYYVKFDLAWPVENYNVGKPQPFVTLGFDF